jgi:hypothetical protein
MKFFKSFRNRNQKDQSQSHQQGTKDLTGVGPPSLNNETVYTSGINQRYQNQSSPSRPQSRLHLEQLHVQNCPVPQNSTGNRDFHNRSNPGSQITANAQSGKSTDSTTQATNDLTRSLVKVYCRDMESR